MRNLDGMPRTFPVNATNAPVRRRAVFSRGAVGIDANHVGATDDQTLQQRHRRRPDDDSLRLIDDLTNRPMDPLFSDALLTQKRPRSPLTVFLTKMVVFVLCIVVGMAGAIFVRQLHTDPRKQVRESLIGELQQENTNFDKLNNEVNRLHADVVKKTRTMPVDVDDPTLNSDEMSNGMIAVKGSGVVITVADPGAANDKQPGFNPREKTTGHFKRVVTDADLQHVVRLLWQHGAEAIAINGNRVGVSTSVRTAGQTILIGINQVTSPYNIEAIGDAKDMRTVFDAPASAQFYRELNDAGIHPQVRPAVTLKLPAAESKDLTYAKERE
ncbi:Uncharacterized conserved protein YlxW, UPF0749 family [Bifidobacterium bohemicum]|uniref:DUF881 domain-containing protein n=1 Tax=Bifidobacterium bohemicum DSM 22767 TaxID=1437606 RepID=A0A086ZJB2_9BIFI|nr:DUF881 domain-containing protein [Bifidobacterium bohemicum]KFI46612.1 hypothetical protein BBOH_0084 [Bifidobacterium bohemicum DSM 22767]SCB76729.1 Uncharacterized conserved protein YlxW, UPF0749 family [Bifidobacterium bohemicum]